MSGPHVLVLSDGAVDLGRRVAATCGGQVEGFAKRVSADVPRFDDVGARVRGLFSAGQPIVAVMAAGALIRLLAPVLTDKRIEPPVIAVSEGGRSVVPLLGGHRGGNALARTIADGLDAHAAITTAGDARFGVALDEPPEGYRLANPQHAKSVMGELLAGAGVRLRGEAPWLEASQLPFAEDGVVRLTVTEKAQEPEPLELLYHPRTLVLGLGCERGVDADEAIDLAERAIARTGLAAGCLAAVASIDLKADEAAVHAVARHFDVPAVFFSAKQLEAEKARLASPSEVVFAEVGCHGVAEGAALACAGAEGELLVPKTKSKRVTAAIARTPEPVEPRGRPRGRLFVVGIGPGGEGWRSPQVSAMIGNSSDLVGYSLYLDLVGDLAAGARRHDFDLGQEVDRVRHALELAGEGKTVSLVCSGDAGIYAMASLVFETIERGEVGDAARRVDVEVAPGISALQAAAARAGAPLGHDFCAVSLSDLMTPWGIIEQRVRAAAAGDFVIAFYNPVSRRRRHQLETARTILLEHRPSDTPVILATNLGREGESVRVVTLDELRVDDVDMLTVVIVGSSKTRAYTSGDRRTWVYTPRGYADKISEAAQ